MVGPPCVVVPAAATEAVPGQFFCRQISAASAVPSRWLLLPPWGVQGKRAIMHRKAASIRAGSAASGCLGGLGG